MLDESGGVVTRTQDFEPGGQVFQPGRVADYHPREQKQRGGEFSHNAKLQFSRVQRHDESDARSHRRTTAPSAEEAAVASQAAKSAGSQLSGEGFREMTKAQWKMPPCPGLRRAQCGKAKPWGHTATATMDNNFRLVNVYITTDMKITEIPQKYISPGKSPGDDGDNDMHSQLENVSG